MGGTVVILSGPSGVGKDTIIDTWRQKNPLVERVVAYTTRPPRDGEVDGKDYNFVNREDFLKMVDDGAFLEHKEVHGSYYATPLRDLQHMVNKGLIAVLKIDVQGALAAMQKVPDAITIFLMPPSQAELKHRLTERETDTESQIELRLKNAEWEISQADKYQNIVVNDDVRRAVNEIDAIVTKGMDL